MSVSPAADGRAPLRVSAPRAVNDGRFRELDVFRGIAALAVVIYHYTFRFDQLYGIETIPVAWARPGLYGVHFFFLISGFVIAWSLQNANGLYDFALSRISRIYPAYWVALVVTFAVVALLGLPGREFGVGVLLINLSMVQEYLSVPHIDQAYWTLTTELTFYGWITLFYLAGQLKRAEFFFLPLMAIGVASVLGVLDLPLRLDKLLLYKHAHLFAAGIVLHRVHQGGGWRTACWFLPLAGAANFAISPWHDALMLAGFIAVFALAVAGRLRFIVCRPLLWLGGVSYTLYLLHQNIGYALMRQVIAATGNELLAIGVALAVVLAGADLLSRLVERPAARSLRRWLRRAPVTNEALGDPGARGAAGGSGPDRSRPDSPDTAR